MDEQKTDTEAVDVESPEDSPLRVQRFVICDPLPGDCKNDDRTQWWYDTERPLPDDPDYEYVAVQQYRDSDPNDYVRIEGKMALLFTDQCEYYVVCQGCRSLYGSMQWSGGTRAGHDWRERAEAFREKHQREKGWCEFCDPVFGNGGWSI